MRLSACFAVLLAGGVAFGFWLRATLRDLLGSIKLAYWIG
jgi:hypothetical protein